jgi:hypothetical protein
MATAGNFRQIRNQVKKLKALTPLLPETPMMARGSLALKGQMESGAKKQLEILVKMQSMLAKRPRSKFLLICLLSKRETIRQIRQILRM